MVGGIGCVNGGGGIVFDVVIGMVCVNFGLVGLICWLWEVVVVIWVMESFMLYYVCVYVDVLK